MTTADLLELAEHHQQQATYYRKVGDAVRDAAITKRHHDRADWHARHATNLQTLADSFTTHFPETITGK